MCIKPSLYLAALNPINCIKSFTTRIQISFNDLNQPSGSFNNVAPV